MRITFTGPAAREAEEVEEAADWYWERSGDRVRSHLLTDTLVYRVDSDTVRVLAFMHQSRKPDYWQHRR